MNTCKVKIYWLFSKDDGKLNSLLDTRYSTVARFEDIKEKWPKEAWSVVIDFTKHEGKCYEGVIRFLVEWGPTNLLYPGSKFDLFEGSKRVATGEVL